jgi:cytochrome c
MRNALRVGGLAMGLLWLGMTCGMAQSGGTAAEARAMLEKAVAALKSSEWGALAKFMNPYGGFIDRDLHVFCYDTTDGHLTAHLDSRLLGTDIRTLRQKDGSPYGQRIFDANKPGTIVTVDYNSPREGSSDLVPTQAVITIVGREGCGVSYFK